MPGRGFGSVRPVARRILIYRKKLRSSCSGRKCQISGKKESGFEGQLSLCGLGLHDGSSRSMLQGTSSIT